MSSDAVVRTKAGVPVNADFENIVTRDGGFTRVYLVINTNTGRPYTRLSDGTIQPLALGEGTAPQSLATDSSPTFAGATLSGLTASQAVFTNGSKALVSNPVTGSGNVVMSTNPTLVTPTLGVATATSLNKVAVTAPATSATLAIQDGKTLSYDEGVWTPTPTNLTVVGTPTYTGTYRKLGTLVFVAITIASTTSTAATAGSTYFAGLPFTPAVNGVATFMDIDAITSYGNNLAYTDGRLYCPTWPATGTVFGSAVYFI